MKSSKSPAGRLVPSPLRLAALAATAALSLPLLAPAPALASEARPSRSIDQTVALGAAGTVLVDTYKGSVKVSPWDRPEVKVTARIVADGECPEAAKQVEQTRVDVTVHGSEVRIRSDYDSLPKWSFSFGAGSDCGSRPLVHYVISIPKDASLTLKDYKSASVLEGVGGNLDLETYKGTIRASGGAGLRVETYKGEATVAMAGLPKGASLETYKGTIEVSVPKGAAFTLRGETHRGDIDLAGFAPSAAAEKAATTKGRHGHDLSLHQAVNGGGAEVKGSTYKGTIRIRER